MYSGHLPMLLEVVDFKNVCLFLGEPSQGQGEDWKSVGSGSLPWFGAQVVHESASVPQGAGDTLLQGQSSPLVVIGVSLLFYMIR